jgi:hypothetical protein
MTFTWRRAPREAAAQLAKQRQMVSPGDHSSTAGPWAPQGVVDAPAPSRLAISYVR